MRQEPRRDAMTKWIDQIVDGSEMEEAYKNKQFWASVQKRTAERRHRKMSLFAKLITWAMGR